MMKEYVCFITDKDREFNEVSKNTCKIVKCKVIKSYKNNACKVYQRSKITERKRKIRWMHESNNVFNFINLVPHQNK